MKEKITLISTIILAIFLVASLYYGFFIKPKEITYTSFIPTTFSTTKSITETSFITKTEKETTTYTKTETSISTYRIIKEEALIEIDRYIDGRIWAWTDKKPIGAEITIPFIIVNTGEHTLYFDIKLVSIKGIEKCEEKWFVLPFKRYSNTEKVILTPSNRTTLLNVLISFDVSEMPEEFFSGVKNGEIYSKEHIAEVFLTYRVIETNQFITFNSTFTYRIWKESD